MSPGREAVTGGQAAGRRRKRRTGGEDPMVGEATFGSYYGKPIINKPTWSAPDIPGYLFLGGLAGAGSVVAAGAQATGRPALARASKVASAAAANLSLVALVHDLGRRSRFFNMLRTFKPTSPMSVGSWLLAGFAPASVVAAVSDITGLAPAAGALATAAAATIGPGVATYTAALMANTAVPAWHDGYRLMPFFFAASATSAAAGVGLLGAPVAETEPVVRLAVTAGVAEMTLGKLMQKRMGVVAEAFEEGKAKRYDRVAQTLTFAGAATAGLFGRRSRLAGAGAGAALIAGSAFARFALFEAGLISAEDPKYTVLPQRQRSDARERPDG